MRKDWGRSPGAGVEVWGVVSVQFPAPPAGAPELHRLGDWSVNVAVRKLIKGAGWPELVTKAITRAKAGDMSAIHFLYVRFADDVFRYVRSIVHHAPEAEDITQNVFAKLGTAIQKYEPRQVPFAAWILRVARNAALDHLRGHRQIPVENVRTQEAMDRERREPSVRTRCVTHSCGCRPSSGKCSSYVTSSGCRQSKSLTG